MTRLAKFLAANAWELCLLLGGLISFTGLSLWFHLPAALTLLGLALIALGLWGARKWASS